MSHTARRLARIVAIALLALSFRGALCADATGRLGLPLDCRADQGCLVQNHYDLDPGPAWADRACGHLSYDGHTGTDFRVPWAAYLAGVEVRAAADGVVAAVRDGMPDRDVRRLKDGAVRGREAGNGVLLEHAPDHDAGGGGGLTTQYNHLKRGSVLVEPGQRVRKGQALGLVGLSGNTAFPHLELVVRANGVPVDPFTGRTSGCGGDGAPLWDAGALAALEYRAMGLLGAGFAPGRPTLVTALRDGFAPLDVHAPALVFWAAVFGPREGDVVRLELLGPDGATMESAVKTVDRTQAQRIDYLGRRARGSWPPGVYTGRYTLTRPGMAGPVTAERTLRLD